METINSPDGRWSISLCTCTQDMIHFAYGNATLHISARDFRDLVMAMQRIAQGLERLPTESGGERKRKGVRQ